MPCTIRFMRREIFRSDRQRALALLARAPTVHLASTTSEGLPVLRALDAALLEDGVYFHGARAGEKTRCLGRPAVVSAEEVVAHLPSWMFDPQSACPASTLYRSAQVHGTLTEVLDRGMKARALSALMERYQPEGRYEPISKDDPLYRREIDGVLVLRVGLDQVDCKEKLLQNRPPDEVQKVLFALWQRGRPEDPPAIEAIREANPDAPTPSFLLAPPGKTLTLALREGDSRRVEALLADASQGAGEKREPPPFLAPLAQAWVGARNEEGCLVATARALCDPRRVFLCDVAVEPGSRRRGLGTRLVQLLLDHPAVRGVPCVGLFTSGPRGFYARLGFTPKPFPRKDGGTDLLTDLVLLRPPSAPP